MTCHTKPETMSGIQTLPIRHLSRGLSDAPVSLPARRVLFLAGDPAGTLYEIVTGAVMLSAEMDDGRRQIVEIVRPGGLVGLTAGKVHDLNAETLSATLMKPIALEAIAADPALQRQVRQHMLGRMDRLYRHTLLLGRKSASERVATFLVDFLEDEGIVDLHTLTRQEIGDYLGLTIETVSRQLTRLRAAGVITIDRLGTIRVRDRAGLRDRTGRVAAAGRDAA